MAVVEDTLARALHKQCHVRQGVEELSLECERLGIKTSVACWAVGGKSRSRYLVCFQELGKGLRQLGDLGSKIVERRLAVDGVPHCEMLFNGQLSGLFKEMVVPYVCRSKSTNVWCEEQRLSSQDQGEMERGGRDGGFLMCLYQNYIGVR